MLRLHLFDEHSHSSTGKMYLYNPSDNKSLYSIKKEFLQALYGSKLDDDVDVDAIQLYLSSFKTIIEDPHALRDDDQIVLKNFKMNIILSYLPLSVPVLQHLSLPLSKKLTLREFLDSHSKSISDFIHTHDSLKLTSLSDKLLFFSKGKSLSLDSLVLGDLYSYVKQVSIRVRIRDRELTFVKQTNSSIASILQELRNNEFPDFDTKLSLSTSPSSSPLDPSTLLTSSQTLHLSLSYGS
mmetsp:Transcript_1991/g.2863  ORF Transcript_1991/g.2863 Transcript_1991/m.2863 type:complete len:239 (+) Transcript_1991:17-733(+)